MNAIIQNKMSAQKRYLLFYLVRNTEVHPKNYNYVIVISL